MGQSIWNIITVNRRGFSRGRILLDWRLWPAGWHGCASLRCWCWSRLPRHGPCSLCLWRCLALLGCGLALGWLVANLPIRRQPGLGLVFLAGHHLFLDPFRNLNHERPVRCNVLVHVEQHWFGLRLIFNRRHQRHNGLDVCPNPIVFLDVDDLNCAFSADHARSVESVSISI